MHKIVIRIIFLNFNLYKAQTISDCDVNYSCFLFPNNCNDSNCTFIYKWRNFDKEKTEFIIAANVGNAKNNWVAVGLSLDDQMGDDDVVACKTSFNVQHYRNVDHEGPILLNPQNPTIGLSNMNVEIKNNWLICSFIRQDAMRNESFYFDLNNSYFILAAYGELDSDGSIMQHTDKTPSSKKFNFKQQITKININETGAMSTASDPEGVSSNKNQSDFRANEIDSSDCGVNFGCFIEPPNCKKSECTFIYKYAENRSVIRFDLASNVGTTSPSWLAIGFSKDKFMGDDGVVLCKSSGAIEQRYNSIKARPALLDEKTPSIGISNGKVSFQDGWLRCSFDRLKTVNNISNYFDLNKKYHLLAASGLISNGVIMKHDRKIPSDSLVDFTAFNVASGSYNSARIKAHASLMVFAWLLFASTGILFARYYKPILPNVKLNNLEFWFVMHRPLMLMVPLLSIISFLVILSQLEWKWVPRELEVEFAHSIFGIIAISLSFINPFIALFRCDKNSKYRFIFNYIHRTVGLSALLFAIVALYLGSTLKEINLDNNGWGILLGWTLALLFVVLFNELFYLFESENTNNNQSSIYYYNGNYFTYPISISNQSGNIDTNNIMKIIKSPLLIIYVIITIAFIIPLVILIAIAKP